MILALLFTVAASGFAVLDAEPAVQCNVGIDDDYTSVLQLSMSVDQKREQLASKPPSAIEGEVPPTWAAKSKMSKKKPVAENALSARHQAEKPQDFQALPLLPMQFVLPIDDTFRPQAAKATNDPFERLAQQVEAANVMAPFETLAGTAHRALSKLKIGVERLFSKAQSGSSFVPWALALSVIAFVVCCVVNLQPSDSRPRQPPNPQSSQRGWLPGMRRPSPQEYHGHASRLHSRSTLGPLPSLQALPAVPNPYSHMPPSAAHGQAQGDHRLGIYDNYHQYQQGGGDEVPETRQEAHGPASLFEVERASLCTGYSPRGTPTFFEGALMKQALTHLPRLNLFSTGELLGPFEISLKPLLESRISHQDNETAVLGRSQRSGATCAVSGVCSCGYIFVNDAEFCRKCGKPRHEDSQVLVIKSGGLTLVTCGPPEQNGSKKVMQIRGADGKLWGTLKSHGRDQDDVYWYTADPDYTCGSIASNNHKKPVIHIGHVDDNRETLKVCLWDPVSEGLPRGNPPGIRRADELRLAEAFSTGGTCEVHLSACSEEAWLKVLMISLVLSVKVFSELKAGLAA